MARSRTWLFLLAAAILLWLRPWRRLARRLRPGAADVPHPEAAFTGVADDPLSTRADAGRLGAVLDRSAETLERAAGEEAAALGRAGLAPAQPAPEFASPAFFGPGDPDDDEPDLIDAILAHDDELDLEAALSAIAQDDPQPEAAAQPKAAGAITSDVHGASAQDEPQPETPAQSEAPGTIPAGYLNLSDEDRGALIGGPADPADADDADLRADAVGAEQSGRPDDLILIEGIGPRTSTIVTAAGISSFAQLAQADVEQLRAALADAGLRTVDPSTWPEQARLAADGRWDELKELQGRIKNGRLSS